MKIVERKCDVIENTPEIEFLLKSYQPNQRYATMDGVTKDIFVFNYLEEIILNKFF